jgi:hypothetical protein
MTAIGRVVGVLVLSVAVLVAASGHSNAESRWCRRRPSPQTNPPPQYRDTA